MELGLLAGALPAVAGAVNGIGLLALGVFTSHMTGVVARVGSEVAVRRWASALSLAGCWGAFLAGAGLATALTLRARRLAHRPFWRVLGLESLSLLGFAGFVGRGFWPIALLCFAMGLQNALVTKLSGARMRTTHMTGISTDLAIEAVRLWTSWRALARGLPFGQQLATLRHLSALSDARHLRLHAFLLASFFAGGLAGPLGYLAVGTPAIAGPVVLLWGLALYDARRGIVLPAAIA